MAAHRDQVNVAQRHSSDATNEGRDESPSDDRPSGVHRHVSHQASSGRSKSSPPGGTRIRKPWELVEEFEHEGHRYRLQRRRIETLKETSLAKREQETLELASEGMTRQQIAKELGLAPSTVGVLLHRASIKLRARSRNELISNYRELTERARTER